MSNEMVKADWVMILSMVKAIIEKAETKEKALQELDALIEEAKRVGKL